MKELILILLLGALSGPVRAADAPGTSTPSGLISIETPVGIYSLNPDEFHLNYSVEIVKKGLPIGHITAPRPHSSSISDPTDLSGEMKRSIRTSHESSARSDRQLKDGLAKIHQDKGAEVPVEDDPVTAATAPDYDFEVCAKSALLLLKKKIAVEDRLDDASVSPEEKIQLPMIQNAIESQLQEHRSSGGVPCGADDEHLKNVVETSDVENIKILAALVRRTGEERAELLKTVALAKNPALDEQVRETFDIFWSKLSLISVFSDQKLPSWEQLLKLILSSSNAKTYRADSGQSSVNVRISISNQELVAGYQKGLNIERGVK